RVGIEPQRQAPELLVAEDARNRLARQPAPGQRGDGLGLRVYESAARLRDERRVLEAERMAYEHARGELRPVEATLAELPRQLPADRLDRRRSLDLGGDRHAAPSAANSSACRSVTSASMISPSASPSITCGNL